MNLPKRVKLLRDNLLVGTHVYRTGDVVEVNETVAASWIKGHFAVLTDEPVTEPGRQRLRSEVIAENALAAGPARAERAVKQPKTAVA